MDRIGVDVVPLARIGTSLERHKDAFLRRILTEKEAEYCDCARLYERVAGRVAAKEAVMKVIGQGWPSLAWTDIEVLPDATGRPVVNLHGKAADFARSAGIEAIDVSITHDGSLAIAVALGLLRGP